jgi:DNA-binding NarL/FixJ family response regulator
VSEQPGALIVDPDPLQLSTIGAIVEAHGHRCISTADFAAARRHLRDDALGVLVTNLRLGAFNGIHLAYLTRIAHPDARILVYAREHDRMLAAETQAAGAFYARQEYVAFSLPAFLRASLPERDRRNVDGLDRRTTFRGGRRTTDIPVVNASPAV